MALQFLCYLLLRFPLRRLVPHAAYEAARRLRRAPKDLNVGLGDAG